MWGGGAQEHACNRAPWLLTLRLHWLTAGLTVQLDASGQLDWLTDLHSLSAGMDSSSSSSMPAGEAFAASSASVSARASAAPPPPPAAVLDWAVSLASSSVRYEPRDTSLTAAVLTVGTISWQAAQGQQQRAVEARRLALHVAAAGSSTTGSTSSSSSCSSSPARRLAGLAASTADLPGFHQVAAEAGITVQLNEVQQAGQQQPEQAAQRPVQELAVSNKGLSITLSRHTLLLLQSLAQQLPARSSSVGGGGSGMQVAGSASRATSPGLEHSASSLAATSAGSGGSRGAAMNVMEGVVQSAYASPRRQAEHPLEASVFLDGEHSQAIAAALPGNQSRCF